MKIQSLTLAAGLLALAAGGAAAAEWSQFRGPSQDGASPEKIRTDWKDLRPLWRTPMHNGFSAITVGDGKAFTLVTAEVDGGDQEVCEALDASSGNALWTQPLGIAKYDGGGDSGTPDNRGGDGPRSTPSYDSGKVYTYSSRMVLKCMDAATGKEIWSCDVLKEHAGRNIHWESAASPLIEGGLVYVAGGGPGEGLLAFDQNDGHVVWKGQDDKMTQSTPVAATILGERQIIFYTQMGLVSVNPKTGEVFWRYPFPFRVATAISPVVFGDLVYCSSAYNVGSGVCKISKSADGKFSAAEVWRMQGSKAANHWSTPVCENGFIYGIFDQAKFGSAPLECLDMATGKMRWAQTGFGPGGCTLVDGHVMALTDAGDLVLVKATPEAYTEVARAHVLAGKCWNVASISNGRVYARSTKEGVSLDLAP